MHSPPRNYQVPDCPSPAAATPPPSTPTPTPPILSLPLEILDQVFDSLSPGQVATIARTCRRLREIASRDSRWERFVSSLVSTSVETPGPFGSFKSLYAGHYAHWFLPKHRIWFSDAYPYGKLLLARYDPRSGSIEAYALAAKASDTYRSTHFLEWEDDVVYRDFHPVVQLDLNQPLIRLAPHVEHPSLFDTKPPPPPFRAEIPMQIHSTSTTYSEHLSRTFLHTRNLPSQLVDRQTSLWPPLTLPAPQNARTRALTQNSYTSQGHKPSGFFESSTTTFRLRQILNFQSFSPLQPLMSGFQRHTTSLPGDRTDTFATLDPRAYTPTPSKPYQGIFVGDYSTHGCEFLLITQPDRHEIRPLPNKARKALQRWPNATPWQALLSDQPGEDDEAVYDDDADLPEEMVHEIAETSLSAALQVREMRLRRGDQLPEITLGGRNGEGETQQGPRRRSSAGTDPSTNVNQGPFHGRLEAIKLTGDPNVPRGEVTFVADDLGEKGLVGHTKERDFYFGPDAAEGRLSASIVSGAKAEHYPHMTGMFDFDMDEQKKQQEEEDACKGTRLVRSIGHICETNYPRRESYIPSQLLLISPDRIAQWWMPYRHVSFYERVDWEKFLKV